MALLIDQIPPEFGWVFFALAFHEFVNIYQVVQVTRARKKFGVVAPVLYKNEEGFEEYDRVQRAHQHTLTENYAPHVVWLIIATLVTPIVSVPCFMLWSISRIVFTISYKNDAKKRSRATFGEIAAIINQLVGLGGALYLIVKHLFLN